MLCQPKIHHTFYHSRDLVLSQPEFIPSLFRSLMELGLADYCFFKGNNIEKHHQLIETTIWALEDIEEMDLKTLEFWINISRIHNRSGMNVDIYKDWTQALLESVKRHDRYYDYKVENEWKYYLEQVISIFKLIY